MSPNGSPPIVVTHERGARFVARVRSHAIVTDQPVTAAGDDSAPTPLELLGAALGSCVALYVQRFLDARGIDAAGVRVEVEQQSARNPSRIAEFTVRIAFPTPVPAMYRALLQRVVRSCPAHNTLEAGAPVHIEIDIPEAATVAP